MMIQDAVSQSWAMIQSVVIRKVRSILLMIGCDPRLSLSHGRTTMNDRSSRSHTIFIFKAPCLEFRHAGAKMQVGQQGQRLSEQESSAKLLEESWLAPLSPARLKFEMQQTEITCPPCKQKPKMPGEGEALPTPLHLRWLIWLVVRMNKLQSARATALGSSGRLL